MGTKQFSQLFLVSCPTNTVNCMKTHLPHNVEKKMDPEHKKDVSKEFKQDPLNVPVCSLCNSRPILKIWWNPFIQFFHNISNRLDVAPSMGTLKQSSHPWNSLARCFVLSSPTYPENHKFHENPFTCFSRNVASKHRSRQGVKKTTTPLRP